MKDLLLPMLFDNGQAIRDGEEIGRLTARVRHLSQELADQQASADKLREALTYSRQAAQTYSELAESYERQRDRVQKQYDEMFEDPIGLRIWVQYNLLDMRSRLVRAMISRERLLAMKAEEGITAAERREMNKGLVTFAYVLWMGVTLFMREYLEAEEMLQALQARARRGELTVEELADALDKPLQNMGIAQEIRLPSWPGISWNAAGAKSTLRERLPAAQQQLEMEMEDGKVVFEPNGNRLIARPPISSYRGDIRTMLEENWAYILDKQFE
ncbi:hypothetical protein [Sulfurivermis fontis]|jgi:hypothetical protein|uniref:hypothetical protein n=1 Tax=Sulfurivermis fontis TaxID=1972068 RepID=UPI000FD758C3|nr:hypothetical protein [Sulfurivermis fontis]